MREQKPPQPAWFLVLFVVIGIAFDSLMTWMGGPGVGAFLLISGVVVAALTTVLSIALGVLIGTALYRGFSEIGPRRPDDP